MSWHKHIEEVRKRMKGIFRNIDEPLEDELEVFPADIEEVGDKLVIRMKLRGFSKEEVSVKATDTDIEVTARHKEKKIKKTGNAFMSERRFGAFRRAFTLPSAINPDTIKVDFENEMLKLKAEKKKKTMKKIEID